MPKAKRKVHTLSRYQPPHQPTESQNLDINRTTEELARFSLESRSKWMQKYFKTNPGEYGQGDLFIGVSMPDLRKVLSKNQAYLALKAIRRASIKINGDLCTSAAATDSQWESVDEHIAWFIKSKIHEHRMVGVLILVSAYQTSWETNNEKNYTEKYFKMYLDHWPWLNNWDLIDCSAHLIVGHYVYHFLNNLNDENTSHTRTHPINTDQVISEHLLNLVDAKLSIPKHMNAQNQPGNLKFAGVWQTRIAMVATKFLIVEKNSFQQTIMLATHILEKIYALANTKDAELQKQAEYGYNHHLIHKATGWMLREVGKRDRKVLCDLLDRHAHSALMPRLMLRTAVEIIFTRSERKKYQTAASAYIK